jgi:hypothetical protein
MNFLNFGMFWCWILSGAGHLVVKYVIYFIYFQNYYLTNYKQRTVVERQSVSLFYYIITNVIGLNYIALFFITFYSLYKSYKGI